MTHDAVSTSDDAGVSKLACTPDRGQNLDSPVAAR